MLVLYLVAGVVLVFFGIITAIHECFTLTAVTANEDKTFTMLCLVETVASTAVGIVYLYSYLKINSFNTTFLEEPEETQEYDKINDNKHLPMKMEAAMKFNETFFGNRYTESYLLTLLNSNNKNNKSDLEEQNDIFSTNFTCDEENCEGELIFLVYNPYFLAFALSFATLVASGKFCDECVQRLKNEKRKVIEVQPSGSDDPDFVETISAPQQSVTLARIRESISNLKSSNPRSFCWRYVFLLWVVPLACLAALYLSLISRGYENENEESHSSASNSSHFQMIEDYFKVTNLSQKKEIDSVVTKIFDIVTEVNNTAKEDYLSHHNSSIFNILEILKNHRMPKSLRNTDGVGSHKHYMHFKMFLLLSYLLLFFVPICYSNAVYVKSKILTEDTKVDSSMFLRKNNSHLKRSLLISTAFYTPATILLFVRTFFMNMPTSEISEGLLTLGNVYLIYRYIYSWKALSSLTRKNFVRPLKELAKS